MRHAQVGDVWEWCSWDSLIPGVIWEPVLLLECLRMSDAEDAEERGLHDWKALDLLTGRIDIVFNVPALGWEKIE